MVASSEQPFVVTSGEALEEAEADDDEADVEVPLVLKDEVGDDTVEFS